jgi:acyl-CoA dehydrogenase
MAPDAARSWETDDVRTFRDTVRRFVHDEFVPRQHHWRTQHGPDAEAWLNAGRIGMLLPDVPAEYGGGNGTFARERVVRLRGAEQIGRAHV